MPEIVATLREVANLSVAGILELTLGIAGRGTIDPVAGAASSRCRLTDCKGQRQRGDDNSGSVHVESPSAGAAWPRRPNKRQHVVSVPWDRLAALWWGRPRRNFNGLMRTSAIGSGFGQTQDKLGRRSDC